MIWVFFDVDGVLNKKSDWVIKYSVNNDCVKSFSKFIKLLQKKDNVRLVICSTWRAGLSNVETKQITNLKQMLTKYDLEIYGSTPVSNKGRQKEVEYYMKRNMSGSDSYIIIDDDLSLYYDTSIINIYKPNYITGFTDKDVKPALRQIER